MGVVASASALLESQMLHQSSEAGEADIRVRPSAEDRLQERLGYPTVDKCNRRECESHEGVERSQAVVFGGVSGGRFRIVLSRSFASVARRLGCPGTGRIPAVLRLPVRCHSRQPVPLPVSALRRFSCRAARISFQSVPPVGRRHLTLGSRAASLSAASSPAPSASNAQMMRRSVQCSIQAGSRPVAPEVEQHDIRVPLVPVLDHADMIDGKPIVALRIVKIDDAHLRSPGYVRCLSCTPPSRRPRPCGRRRCCGPRPSSLPAESAYGRRRPTLRQANPGSACPAPHASAPPGRRCRSRHARHPARPGQCPGPSTMSQPQPSSQARAASSTTDSMIVLNTGATDRSRQGRDR